MPDYMLTAPDGRKFKVTAPSPEAAAQAFKKMAPSQPVGPDPREGIGQAERQGNAFAGSFIESIPVIGAPLKSGLDKTGAGLASLIYGVPYDEALANIQEGTKRNVEDNPGTALAGQVAGAVAPLGIAGMTATGARALGMTGPTLGGRVLNSALSGAAISGADTAARGGDMGDVATSAAIGGGVGGAVPLLGAGLKAGYNAAKGTVQRAAGSSNVADDMLGRAFAADQAASKVMSQADEAVARAGGAPVYNVDRGGPTVKALARDVANKSPQAWEGIEDVASARFKTQSGRLVDLFSKITGGQLDDVAVKDSLLAGAKKANAGAYGKAYANPRAASMWDDTLQKMTSSPAMQAAIRDVEKESANRAVLEGSKAVKNPFTVNADGTLSMKPGVMPTLEFWDHVKRNLDKMGQTAARQEGGSAASTYSGLSRMLRGHLDGIVPEYKAARQGAARFFEAEDAIEAGQKFFSGTRNLNEARKAIAAMSPAERKGFAFGYAAEAAAKAKSLGDSRNALTAMFGSPEAREKLAMTFGRTQAAEIEAFVRVEDALDKTRRALGNSTTAKQLLQAIGVGFGAPAIGAGAGGAIGALATGDIGGAAQGAIAGAAVGASRKGLQRIMSGADEKIMAEVAEKLLSQDPKVIEQLLKRVAGSQAHMNAISTFGAMAGALARGGTVAIGASLANQE